MTELEEECINILERLVEGRPLRVEPMFRDTPAWKTWRALVDARDAIARSKGQTP